MALLGYKAQFVDPLRSGQKNGTIRTVRKYPVRERERLYHYTGLRTKHAFKIGESLCITCEPITILLNSGVIVIDRKIDLFSTETVDVYKGEKELNKFAYHDGFRTWQEMKAFWLDTHGTKKGKRKVILVPFQGIYIRHTKLEYQYESNYSGPSLRTGQF